MSRYFHACQAPSLEVTSPGGSIVQREKAEALLPRVAMKLKIGGVDPGSRNHVVCINDSELVYIATHGEGLGDV